MDIMFENFKKIFFDGLEPNEYANQIRKFSNYLDRINHDFYKEYTYCTGCKQMVKKNEVYAEPSNSLTFPNRSRIMCKKCNTVWFIRDDNDDE